MPCPHCQRPLAAGADRCPACGHRLPWRCAQCGGENPFALEACRLCGKPRSRASAYAASAPSPDDPPRGLTPFTGRAQELATLLSCLELASAGHGQSVAITGEAGLGKSRLRLEFCLGLNREDVMVLEGRCQAEGIHTPYLPFVHALRRSLQFNIAENSPEIARTVADKILAVDRGLKLHLPLLLHLLSLTSPEYPLPVGLAGEEYRLALEAALLASVAASARRRPTILVLEDWHWADQASRSALKALLAGVTALRLMILVVSREDLDLDPAIRAHHTALLLAPLKEPDTEAIIQAVLETSRLPAGFATRVHERTAGNPFFAEEICLSLREEGALKVADRAATLTRDLDALALPRTVQTILQARIERLDIPARRMLERAAVLGREFDLRILETVSESPEALADALALARGQDLIYPVRTAIRPTWRFKHVLTQVAVYASLAPEDRTALHARVLRSMEVEYAVRVEEAVEAFAYHAMHGELWEETVAYSRQAALKALARSAFQEAGLALEQGLAAHAHLRTSEDQCRVGVDLRLMLHPAYMPQGRFEDMLKQMDLAEAGALALADDALLARITALRGYYLFFMGDFRRALPATAAGVAYARRDGRLAAQVTANFYAGITRYATAEFREAIRVLTDTIDAIPESEWFSRFDSAGLPAPIARSVAAACYAELGDFRETIRLGDEALAITERANLALNTMVVCWLYSMALTRKGDYEPALRLAEKALSLASHGGGQMVFSQLTAVAGECYLHLGRAEEAVALLEQGVVQRRFNGGYKFMVPFVTLAETYLHLGQVVEAATLVAQALERSRTSGDRRSEAWTLRMAGLVAISDRRAPPAEAERLLQEALALATRLDMSPLAAHCHAGLGLLFRQRGNRPAGDQEMATALGQFRALDMPFWIKRLETAPE